MADRPSNEIQWSRPQGFTIAPRGYWSVDVHRLLDNLERAHSAGKSLGPILDGPTLSEVGLGYDMAEVNAFLDKVRASDTPHLSQDHAAKGIPLPERGEALYPPPQEGSKLSVETLRALQGIESAKFLPAPHQFEQGYDAREVDRFFEGLSFAVRSGLSVVSEVRQIRFAMANPSSKAYDVRAVDALVDRLEELVGIMETAGGSRLPGLREHPDRRAIAWPQVGLGFGVLGIVAALFALLLILLS